MRTNVILAGKCNGPRHSTTNFRENVVMSQKSYQMSVGILSFGDRERTLPPSTEITELNFVGKKVQ